MWIFLAANGLFLALNVIGFGRQRVRVDPAKPETLGAIVLGYCLLLVVPVTALGISGLAWYELRGPNSYQYRRDFSFVRYAAPDGSFELQYPADWKTLLPSEAAAETQSALVPTAAARLFVGNPGDWSQNVNIQIAAAPYRDGQMFGDDEDELATLLRQFREVARQMDRTVRIASDGIEESGGIYRMRIVVSRESQGVRVGQSSVMFIMNGRLVTITATAPQRFFRGLSVHRFEKILDSFRMPAASK